MAEGDTIHRAAARLNAALGGRRLELAQAPNPRSPIHHRAAELVGRMLVEAEARGKHLLVHLSEGDVLHSHLGVEGRWIVRSDGRLPRTRAWLVLASGRGVAAQTGGRLLRLVSEARARNDPGLLQLGPDPLRPGFDAAAASSRLLAMGAGRAVGEALLDQQVLAGVGNVIRVEACFNARVSPWRPVTALETDEAEGLVAQCAWVMHTSMRRGRRPQRIYGRVNRPCPRCGTPIRSRGQGDANRIAYWCPSCQR